MENEIIESIESEEIENWKPKVLLIGGGLGAITGLVAAILFVQRAERENSKPELSIWEGIQIGLLLLGVLRSVARLSGED